MTNGTETPRAKALGFHTPRGFLMSEYEIKTKHFSEGELVSWELSPYHEGIGTIRGKVEGIPGLDDDWWIVELEEPKNIAHYDYSCIVVPGYRLSLIR